jgi:hypothetical protein
MSSIFTLSYWDFYVLIHYSPISLPEMRSDELVNKISGEVINGEKPRRFQIMVLVLFTNNDFHGTFHGALLISGKLVLGVKQASKQTNQDLV